jgi:ABC-type Fe3+-hydroxamate transport system substrate-binding protein
MNKKLLFIYLILVFFLSIQACTSSQSNPVEPVITEAVKEELSIPTYTVTKSTGLYDAFDVDANIIAELSVGTKLIPSEGATSLECGIIDLSSVEYELCQVEVFTTGQRGWVMRQWISRDY